MADLFGGAKISAYDDRIRLMGLGSDFDTQGLLDATIEMMKLKNNPYEKTKAIYEDEKSVWTQLETAMTNFTSMIKDVKDLSASDKKTTVSDASALTFTATSSAVDATYKIDIKQLATYHKVRSDSVADATQALGYAETTKINGKDFEFTADMSLADTAKKINDGDYKVNAVVIGGSLILTSKDSGAANAMTLEGTAFENLGLLSNGAFKNEVQKAQDAQYTVDGVNMTSASNTIRDGIEGATLQLTKVQDNVMVAVSKNNDTIKEKVKTFVNGYNQAIALINQWTAKEAVLQGKTIPNRIKSDMSAALMKNTDSSLMMYQIGISIDGVAKNGTITFDETKLDEQLDKNPEEVMKLLTGDNSVGKTLYDKLYDMSKSTGTIQGAIDGLTKRIDNIDKTIAKNEQMFQIEQQTLLRKFASFDMMMNDMNTTMDYLTAQIDAMNKKD